MDRRRESSRAEANVYSRGIRSMEFGSAGCRVMATKSTRTSTCTLRVGCTQVQQVIVEFLQNIIGFSYLVPISLYVTIGNSGPGPTPPDPNPVPNPCPPSSSVPSYNRAFRVAMLCGSHLRYNYCIFSCCFSLFSSPFFFSLLFCIAVCVCQCLFASLFDSHC